MTKAMPLADFVRLPPMTTVEVRPGLSGAIDAVAEHAAPAQRFLRYGWFAAALEAYGGEARTLIVSRESVPVMALPIVRLGPALLPIATVPGSYWPFRTFPVREDAGVEAAEALLAQLARETMALRLGPVPDGDPALELLRYAGETLGWTMLDRRIAEAFLLDLTPNRADSWPRSAAISKNRYLERKLAAHGQLAWRSHSGADWNDSLFADLASIESRSWVGTSTDRKDAKFLGGPHTAFWRAVANDTTLAAMMKATMLDIDGLPAAFFFDLNPAPCKYVIANSFDPRFSKGSPGRLLAYRNFLEGVADGIRTVDWGAGDTGYKSETGAKEGPMLRDWLFVRPGVAGAASRLLRGAWARSGHVRQTGEASGEG